MTAKSESRAKNPLVPWIGAACLLTIMFAAFAVVWSACLGHTEGHFTYALDDPYIHLAIAKNLAHHGIWGVTEFAPASASSSPLWTGLLGLAMFVFGNSVHWPFLLGILFSVAATLFAYHRFLHVGLTVEAAAASSLAIFAIGPLFMLPFNGMEHSLQIFLDLIFGFWLLAALGRERVGRDLLIVAALTSLMCLCRYESVFLVVVPFGVSCWRRDWQLAAGLALGPAVAIGGFGLYSHLVGMPWVPNSILTKGHLPHSTSLGYLTGLGNRIFWTLWDRGPILGCMMLVALGVALALRFRKLAEPTASLQIWIWTTLIASCLHAGFAMMGYLYRYEGYLLVSLVAGTSIGVYRIASDSFTSWTRLSEDGQKELAKAGIFGMTWVTFTLTTVRTVVLVLAVFRGYTAYRDVPKASSDIYLQQSQMARFVNRYYPNGRLAANDIGAVSYFSNIHLLDLVGLATDTIRQDRMEGNYNTAAIAKEIDNFKPDLIIAYPQWFTGKVSFPGTLIPVAGWEIPPVTSAASRIVVFYATSQAAVTRIHQQLVEFQPELPAAVKVRYTIFLYH